MMDNYLSITLAHFNAEYPGQQIEVSYLECIDCVIYGDRTRIHTADLLVFVGFAEDSDIHANMYKAIAYATELGKPCIIVFLESERARATEMDYSVKPIYSTPCVHIMLAFDKLMDTIDSRESIMDVVSKVRKYFKLPEECYVSTSVINNMSTNATVRVYTESKGKLTRREINL